MPFAKKRACHTYMHACIQTDRQTKEREGDRGVVVVVVVRPSFCSSLKKKKKKKKKKGRKFRCENLNLT